MQLTMSRDTRKKLRITANTIMARMKPVGKSPADAAAPSFSSTSSWLPDCDVPVE